MNNDNREDIERLRLVQDKTSVLKSREVELLLEELRRENNREKWKKIRNMIRYHPYEQQQYLILVTRKH